MDYRTESSSCFAQVDDISTISNGARQVKRDTQTLTLIVFLFRKQPDHPDLPPAEPVWSGGALPAGHGQTLEIPGHGPRGLPQ